MPRLGRALKIGAYYITNDVDRSGKPYDPTLFLEESGSKFRLQEETARMKAMADLTPARVSNGGDYGWKKNIRRKDSAMFSNNRGGIDLTPANMNLQTKMDSRLYVKGEPSLGSRGNGGIKFHLDPVQLQQLQNAPGFVPVIIDVEPLKDLKSFLAQQNFH
jgi:hypothetical protein